MHLRMPVELQVVPFRLKTTKYYFEESKSVISPIFIQLWRGPKRGLISSPLLLWKYVGPLSLSYLFLSFQCREILTLRTYICTRTRTSASANAAIQDKPQVPGIAVYLSLLSGHSPYNKLLLPNCFRFHVSLPLSDESVIWISSRPLSSQTVTLLFFCHFLVTSLWVEYCCQ